MSWDEPDYKKSKKSRRKIRNNTFKRMRRMKRAVDEGRFIANRDTLDEMLLADVKAIPLYRHGQTIPAPQRGGWRVEKQSPALDDVTKKA